jgi:ammonium transporter Rh
MIISISKNDSNFKIYDKFKMKGGVNNLHGMPGIFSGVVGALIAFLATRESYGNNRLYHFYPARTPAFNSSDYIEFKLQDDGFVGNDNRTSTQQALYQLAALVLTLTCAIVTGLITGLIMKLPIFEQIKSDDFLFDDEPSWNTPPDYSLKLTKIYSDHEETGLDSSSAVV